MGGGEGELLGGDGASHDEGEWQRRVAQDQQEQSCAVVTLATVTHNKGCEDSEVSSNCY